MQMYLLEIPLSLSVPFRLDNEELSLKLKLLMIKQYPRGR